MVGRLPLGYADGTRRPSCLRRRLPGHTRPHAGRLLRLGGDRSEPPQDRTRAGPSGLQNEKPLDGRASPQHLWYNDRESRWEGPTAMGFAYSCFISYSHGQHELMQTFLGDLKATLESSLEPYFREPVYVDDRLRPGYHYNETLAKAMCQSIAMIVVFTPRWAGSDYCQREFRGMLSLERKRRKMAGPAMDTSHGLVIPVLLRGTRADMPDEISDHIHYCDFSRFTTADERIGRHPQYVQQIENIAEYIYEISKALNPFSEQACSRCDAFKLPKAGTKVVVPQQPFPGRAA